MLIIERRYGEDTVYIISYAKLADNIPARALYEYVALGIVVDYKTGIIVDTSCTFISEECKQFVKELLVDYNIHELGIEPAINMIKRRFHGNSQKSLCIALRDNYNKYNNVRYKLNNTVV